MEDSSTSDSTNNFWRYFFVILILLTGLNHFYGSDWLFIILAPMYIGAIYGSWTGRAFFGVASKFTNHASEKALGKWQGKYYSWHNQQIRILEVGRSVWVVDDDLIRAAGLKPDANLKRKLNISYPGYSNIPGTHYSGFNENAVMKFLEGKQSNNPEVVKLKQWFEREVFPPIRRKRV
jgi:hypothetical protein